MVQYSVLIFLTFIAITRAHNFQGWTQMPGGASEISAKGNEVWVINRGQQIYRWVNGAWQHIPGAAVRAGASPDGWTWVVNAGHAIYRFNPISNSWQQIPGGLSQISAASKDRAMGVNPSQQIFLWENNAWRQLPGAATWAAICDNDERWVVNSNDDIFHWSHQSQNWNHIPGKLVNIDCQSGNRIIGANRGGAMYVYENGEWQQLPGACSRATITHVKAYCVNSGDGIFEGKFADPESPPPPAGSLASRHTGWTQMPGAASEISAKGNEIWVINRAQQIYRWVNGGWQHIPGAAVKAGASPDGWSWVVNAGHAIYRFNPNVNNWEQIPGGLSQISAASRDRAMGVNPSQQIFLWENNAWRQLPGAATWAAICDNDDRWVVNSAQNIYRWNHQSNNWNQVPGSLLNIDCQSPDRVIGTDTGGAMYLYEDGKWNRISGVCTRASITHDKTYCVNAADGIFTGSFGSAAAAAAAAEDREVHKAVVIEEGVDEDGRGHGRGRGRWRDDGEEEVDDGEGREGGKWRKKIIVIEREE